MFHCDLSPLASDLLLLYCTMLFSEINRNLKFPAKFPAVPPAGFCRFLGCNRHRPQRGQLRRCCIQRQRLYKLLHTFRRIVRICAWSFLRLGVTCFLCYHSTIYIGHYKPLSPLFSKIFKSIFVHYIYQRISNRL